MGVIKRQSIKRNLVNYIGLAIGVVNILFIYPLALGEEKLGIITFITSVAGIFVPFLLFGLDAVVIRFFPLFRTKNNRHTGFLTFLLLWLFLGTLIFLVLIFFSKETIIQFYSNKSPEYLIYLPYAIPLIILIAIVNVLSNYSFNFQRIVVPGIFSQLIKIVQPVLALCFFWGIISFSHVMDGLIVYYITWTILLAIYIKYLGQWNLNFDFIQLKSNNYKKIFTYAGFGILGSLGSVLTMKIDGFMVASLTTFSQTGIYSIAIFMANAIALPTEALFSITSPIISAAWAKNNRQEINNIYKKSSIVLLTVGLFLFLNLWLNLDSLFSLMPRGEIFKEGKYVVLILGLGKLIDMATSVNGHIIAFSKYFRFNFYFLLLLAVFNVVCNLLFIPNFGINGAAFATAVSLFLFNLVKFLFVWAKFKLFPFSLKSIYLLGISFFTFLLVSLLPSWNQPILNILINSLSMIFIFIPLILFFKISEDINSTFWQFFTKIKNIYSKIKH